MPDVKTKIKVAILDMYEGAANQGMRCIRELLKQYAVEKNIDILSKEFEVRLKKFRNHQPDSTHPFFSVITYSYSKFIETYV